MIAVFFDANVLFSAAWREGAGVVRLWHLQNARLMTSAFAIAEAQRNLQTAERCARLDRLLLPLEIAPEATDLPVHGFESLRAKDKPILQAAIAAGADYLVTGDWRDFGPWMGAAVRGVQVRTPAMLLAELGQ